MALTSLFLKSVPNWVFAVGIGSLRTPSPEGDRRGGKGGRGERELKRSYSFAVIVTFLAIFSYPDWDVETHALIFLNSSGPVRRHGSSAVEVHDIRYYTGELRVAAPQKPHVPSLT
jgi:hypothetical protein